MKRQVQTEHAIIRQALDTFHNSTGLTVQELPPVATKDGFEPDVVVKVTSHREAWQFSAVVKTNISPATIGSTIGRLAHAQPKGLLLTRYVTPNMAEELREKGIQFLDTAGNAYLHAPRLFIFVKGNRPAVAIGAEKTKRAFQPSGLRVLFAFLLRPSLVTAPYREIANTADVALGTVGWVVRDLKELGYLVDMGHRGRRLARKSELLDRWVTAYPEQLRPKLLIGSFRAANPNWQEETGDLSLLGACWGGEPAAARMTGQLKPQTVTVYTREDADGFILRNKLRKDPQGNIEILKTFWDAATQKEYGDQAPPLVVYADLLATADPRNIEIAKMIYEQKIHGLIREN